MRQKLGRPRFADIDAALIAAAEGILLEGGFRALTIQAVCDRAGTTRPAFYRRYSGLAELTIRLLQSRFGEQLVVPDSGDLLEDLLWVQRYQVRMFADPLASILPGLLDALRDDEELRSAFVDEFFQPRRRATKDVLDRAVRRGEILAPRDPEWVCDKITGPIVLRVLFPSLGPIDEALARATAEDAVAELRRT